MPARRRKSVVACETCQAPATRRKSGPDTCGACILFIWRTMNRAKYNPCRKKGKCKLTPEYRKCSECRFLKTLRCWEKALASIQLSKSPTAGKVFSFNSKVLWMRGLKQQMDEKSRAMRRRLKLKDSREAKDRGVRGNSHHGGPRGEGDHAGRGRKVGGHGEDGEEWERREDLDATFLSSSNGSSATRHSSLPQPPPPGDIGEDPKEYLLDYEGVFNGINEHESLMDKEKFPQSSLIDMIIIIKPDLDPGSA